MALKLQFRSMLESQILPFWMKLIDHQHGGYFGYMDSNFNVHYDADKGSILHSRILWTFSASYTTLKNEELIHYARHVYQFIKEKLIDREQGGLFWMVDSKGNIIDASKHVYNMAFGIYGLSEYYAATNDEEALQIAISFYRLIEEKAKRDKGYLESFDRGWNPVPNQKLGGPLSATYTMNTHLHVLEAYTNLYKVWPDDTLKERIVELLRLFKDDIYNSETSHLNCFFNESWQSLTDVISFGHDIETSWLLDEAIHAIQNVDFKEEIKSISRHLAESVFKEAYQEQSVINEKNGQHVDLNRVWWVQAEAVVGFFNYYQKTGDTVFLDATKGIFEFINRYLVIEPLGEWYWSVNHRFVPNPMEPVVEPWKCPYHNGRMCIEMLRRTETL